MGEERCWVCPHCDAELDADAVGDTCPACGVKLEDDE
jgi:rubrerythrin